MTKKQLKRLTKKRTVNGMITRELKKLSADTHAIFDDAISTMCPKDPIEYKRAVMLGIMMAVGAEPRK